MLYPACIHGLEFAAPPGQQAQAFLAVTNFVAQIVGPTAEGVDVIEVLVQPLGQQKADYVEVFVMMRGQPAGILLGGSFAVGIAQRLRRVDVLFGGEQGH